MHYPTIHMPSGRTMGGGGDTNSMAAMVLAFLGGALLGMVVGKKKTLMMTRGEGMEGMGMGGRMPMWKHHHHDFGQSACRMRHGSQTPAAPGAVGEGHGERDEGE